LAASNKKSVIHVLHVDDDLSLQEITKLMLLDLDSSFEIDCACCVDEALKKLSTGHYDVVVSDYEMPQKNGLQFLTELREQNNKIPFILFTGKGREEVAIQALNLGAEGYHNKQGSPETVYGELAHSIKLIVDRYKLKEVLREQDIRFRKLAAQTPGMLFQFLKRPDGTFRVPFTSDGIYDIFGCSPQDVKEDFSPIARAIVPEDLEKVIRSIEYSAAHLSLWQCEYRIQLSGQKIRWLWGQSAPERLEDGSILWSGYNTDITERKKTEDSIIQERGMLESVTKNIGSGLVLISKDYRILWMNNFLRQFTGASENNHCYSSFNTCTTVCPDCGPKKIFEGASFDRREYCNQTEFNKDHPVWFELIATPIKDEDGNVIAALELTVNITEKKEAEQKLKENSKKIELMNEKLRVVGSLTRHDVRNKLSTVTGYAYLLKKKHADQVDIVEGLGKMEQSVRETVKIFEFAKMYEQLGAEQLTPIDVEAKLTEASTLFSGSLPKIINECRGLTVLADSFLRQLFYNFIDNTRKYGKKTTTIKVYFEKVPLGGLHLIYEDDGVGIPLENKPNLFREGFSTGGSTGFGLFLTKRMMDVYGWAIKENGETGKGAKFTIAIPKINKQGRENYQTA
jgi:PAS domain S-box-containing protein